KLCRWPHPHRLSVGTMRRNARAFLLRYRTYRQASTVRLSTLQPSRCAGIPMLTSEDLRLFLAIIREGSMYAAGRRLEVDHSTIVRRLSVLEARLDTRLFDRSTRGVTPTQAA